MARIREAVCLVCILGLTSLASRSLPALATPDRITWSPDSFPTAGKSGSRVLAAGTSTSGSAIPQSGLSCTQAKPTVPSGSLFMSSDQGEVWHTVAFTESEAANLLDLAPSPDYPDDKTLFLLTWDGEHSLWRSQNSGETWEQIFPDDSDNVDSLSRVSVTRDGAVYLAGTSLGNPAIWRSTDNGESFSLRTAPAAIDTWAVVNEDTLFLAEYDGSHGLVYRTSNGGQSFSSPATVGNVPLNDIALSPAYSSDKTLLAGASDGRVYWSDDGSGSFEPLPDSSTPPLEGTVSVAFDPDFRHSHTVYAASDAPGGGIYRFVIGESTEWENIGGPADGMVGDLAVSTSGVLYAADFSEDGGLERSLDPTSTSGPTLETLIEGLETGATLTRLWLTGTRLWSLDTSSNRLMTLSDTLSLPVSLVSPEDGEEAVGTAEDGIVKGVTLEWQAASGAAEYEWQISDDGDFSEIPFAGHTAAISRKPTGLEPDTIYYWRVRASQPVFSPWPEAWSFTTSDITEETIAAPNLRSPETGATDVPLKPLFRWSAVTGATNYELVVSTRKSLADPVILKSGDYALSDDEWESSTTLEYHTTYYWKVRGVSADTEGDWSEVGEFTTLEAPEPNSAQARDSSQSPAPQTTEPAPEPMPETSLSPTNTAATSDRAVYLIVGLVVGVVTVSAILLSRRSRERRR